MRQEDDTVLELRVLLPARVDPQRNQQLFLERGALMFRPLFHESDGHMSCFRCCVMLEAGLDGDGKVSDGGLDRDVMTMFDTNFRAKAVFRHDMLHLQRHDEVDDQSCLAARLLRLLQQCQEVDERELMCNVEWGAGTEFGASERVDHNRVVDAAEKAWNVWQNKNERGWFTQDIVLDKMRWRKDQKDDVVALNSIQTLAYFVRVAGLGTERNIFQLPCLVFERPSQPHLMCVGRRLNGRWVVEMELTHTRCQQIMALEDSLPFCWEWVLVGWVVMSANDRKSWKYKSGRRQERFRFADEHRVEWLTVLLAEPAMNVFDKRQALELLAPSDWRLATSQRCDSYRELVTRHRASPSGLLVQRGWERGHLSRGVDVGTYDRVNKQWINWTKPDFAKDGAKVVGAVYSKQTGRLQAWEVVWQGKRWTARVDLMPLAYKQKDWQLERGMTVGIVVNRDVIKPKAYALDFDTDRGGYCGDGIDDYVDFLMKARYNLMIDMDE